MSDVVNQLQLEDSTPSTGSGVKLLPQDLSLIEHVKVDLQIEVGTSQISVSTLFNLKVGHTLTLDQAVDQPMTVLLNGKAIAKGQLVAVDDQYGIYITHILD
jgi:flagellar motor switch protein FliN/FliY